MLAVENAMYDSDSSEEEARRSRTAKQTSVAPLQLPFQAEALPVGVGAKERPVTYEIPDPQADPAISDVAVGPLAKQDVTAMASPFVDANNKEGLSWEKDSWFMVQFPTRMPPLKPKRQEVLPGDDEEEAKADNVVSNDSRPMQAISEVVTPPVAANSFDNTLLHTAPGRIGKIVVYKSGKTVLVMEGPDGVNKVCVAVRL